MLEVGNRMTEKTTRVISRGTTEPFSEHMYKKTNIYQPRDAPRSRLSKLLDADVSLR